MMMSKTSSNQFIFTLVLHAFILFSSGSAFVINLSSSSERSCNLFFHRTCFRHRWYTDDSIRTVGCHASPDKSVFRLRHSSPLRQRRDPTGESMKNSLVSNHPILRLLSSPARAILWSWCKAVLRLKLTAMLVMILLGRQLFHQTPPQTPLPKTAVLLGLLGTILVDVGNNNKARQMQEEGDNDNNDWTPEAQSKIRLFWQFPALNKRKETADNFIYKRDSTDKFNSSTIGYRLRNFMFVCKKMLRYMVEKTTVYVLECENNKYYIGSTVNLKRRMNQHFHNSRSGSVWTKKHKPIRVLKMYRRVPYKYKLGFESQVTAELMWEKGINNVRGAMYLFSRDYTTSDLNALVSFIGHYTDLSYTYVRSQLSKELAENTVDNAKTRRKEQRKHLQKEYAENKQATKMDDVPQAKSIRVKPNRVTAANKRPKYGNDGNDEDENGIDQNYKAMDDWLNRKIDELSCETDDPNNNSVEDL